MGEGARERGSRRETEAEYLTWTLISYFAILFGLRRNPILTFDILL